MHKNMHISITGHHLSITPAIEETIKSKLAKVSRHFDHINSMQVILSLDNHHSESSHKGKANHKAEIILRVPNNEIFVHATDDDMYQSINKVAKKLDRQIRKHKTKVRSHKAQTHRQRAFSKLAKPLAEAMPEQMPEPAVGM